MAGSKNFTVNLYTHETALAMAAASTEPYTNITLRFVTGWHEPNMKHGNNIAALDRLSGTNVLF